MYKSSVNNFLTHRDYGPSGNPIALGFPRSLSSRRLNITFPRGEIACLIFKLANISSDLINGRSRTAVQMSS